MRTGKHSYKDLFVNRYVTELVIPEIQRDYVWQEKQVVGFLNSLFESFEEYNEATVPQLEAVDGIADERLSNDFKEFYRKRNFSANIGFIYAYSDEQYQGRYFLIDGQQRITTMYLLLLLLAARNGIADDFIKYYCKNGKPILDYRVRDSSQNFLINLVPILIDDASADVEDQAWFLSSYKHDATISNIIGALNTLNVWLGENSCDESLFYEYLQNYTEFWYFDTNISAQGENLYIYLNARGELVQGNENLKAELLSRLSSDSEKNDWGKQWEEWQDLFWRLRSVGRAASKNLNADKGFNAFLACVAALQCYLNNNERYLISDKRPDVNVSPVILTENLSLENIKKFVKALCYIDDNKGEFCKLYDDATWVDKCFTEFWQILNLNNTAWFIDYKRPETFSTQTNHMVFVWSILLWLAEAENKDIPLITVFRGVRQFYLRYMNNIRAAAHIRASVENLIENGLISRKDDKPDEEYMKERWLYAFDESEDKRKIESLIWGIEDHPYNLQPDAGASNISHLVDFDDELTIQKLEKIASSFYGCFPTDRRKHLPMQSLLLCYGNFWRQRSPYYYKNYQFDDWKHVIRKKEFKQVLEDIIKSGQSVEELLATKRAVFDPSAKVKSDDLNGKLKWYDYYLKERMWSQGNYIAIDTPYEGEDEDLIFPDSLTFHNTKGDFRGGDPKVLADLLPKKYVLPGTE